MPKARHSIIILVALTCVPLLTILRNQYAHRFAQVCNQAYNQGRQDGYQDLARLMTHRIAIAIELLDHGEDPKTLLLAIRPQEANHAPQ
jgi:hypothetical protein